MQSVKSYTPRDKVAKPSRLCGFLKSDKKSRRKKTSTTSLSGASDIDTKGKKLKIKNPRIVTKAIIYSTTTVILIALVIISAYNNIRWSAENAATETQLSNIIANTKIEEVDDSPTINYILNNKNLIAGDDLYWQYVKVPLMSVDLAPSIEINQDTAGWIQVVGTNINYPYVQTDNNDYYLWHTINRSWSSAGWVFLDYRNNKSLTDQNQIIYGHGRYDGSMFGSLSDTLNEAWQNDTNNHLVKISTATGNSLWQVFSVYQTHVTEDYLTINFIDDQRFQSFIDMITERSVHKFATKVTTEDKILTLSTCANGDERIVLHAKLIKKDGK